MGYKKLVFDENGNPSLSDIDIEMPRPSWLEDFEKERKKKAKAQENSAALVLALADCVLKIATAKLTAQDLKALNEAIAAVKSGLSK